jgi:hypothetical protein
MHAWKHMMSVKDPVSSIDAASDASVMGMIF